MSNYYRLRIERVHPAVEAELSKKCIEYGSTGTAESLDFAQPDLTYDARIMKKSMMTIDAFFLEAPKSDVIQKLKDEFPQQQFQLLTEENQDWLTEWKKHFKPFQLIQEYWVVPSWMESPVPPEVTITIDPGMAFGTGTHATTQMASYFVQKLCKKHSAQISNWSFLDVGTGTGILGILSDRCGAGMVTGIEIDPEARRVAKENIKINACENFLIKDQQLDEIRETFDVVIANIIDGVLIRIKEDLLQAMKPGAFLFLTGILTEREDHFFQKFVDDERLEVIQRLEKDEWIGYWVKKT